VQNYFVSLFLNCIVQLNEDVWAFNSTLEDNRLTVVKTIPVSFWSKSWTRTRIDQPTCMTQLHQMRFYTEKFPVLPVKLLTLFRDNLNTCSHVTYTGNCWSWPSHSWVECLPVVYHSEHQLDCTGQDGWQRVCIVSRFWCLKDSSSWQREKRNHIRHLLVHRDEGLQGLVALYAPYANLIHLQLLKDSMN